MLTEDYLIRQISILIAILTRILGFKKAFFYVEARREIDEALQEIFGLRADLVRQMDDLALMERITRLDILDVDRLLIAAEVFRYEGEILEAQGNTPSALKSLERALNFYLDVDAIGGLKHLPEPEGQPELLISRLRNESLDVDTWYGIMLYGVRKDNDALIFDAFDHLLEDIHLVEELRSQATHFYQSLLEKEAGYLEKITIQRAEIVRRLSKIDTKIEGASSQDEVFP